MKDLFPQDYNIYPKSWLYPQNQSKIKSFFNKKKQTLIFKQYGSKSTKADSIPQNTVFTCSSWQEFQSRLNQNKDLQSDVNGHMQKSSPRKPVYLVQRYIQNQLILESKRFHINLYCLITSCKPLTFFLHQNGIVKLFDDSVEKQSFGISSKFRSQQINLDQFFMNVPEEKVNHIKLQIKDVIIKTMLSIKYDLTHAYQDVVGANYKTEQIMQGQIVDLFDQCFELIKFKVIIDQNYKVWLVGVK